MIYAFEGEPAVVAPPKGVDLTGTWSYRDGGGAVVAGLNSVAYASGQVVIPAAAHTLIAPSLFALRFVRFSGSTETVSVTVIKPYMLTATTTAARTLIGFNEAELPDGELDFHGAALDLDVKAAGAFRPLLATSTEAQRLVLLHALVLIEPSMRARIAQSMSTDAVAFSRFRDLDLGDVLDAIRGERDELGARLIGAAAVPELPAPTVFALGATRDDPFPGA